MASLELEAQREVQALLDTPLGVRRKEEGSGVVERLKEKQREKYEQLVANLQKELSAISESLESEVRDGADQLKQRLENTMHEIEAGLAIITDSDHLTALRLEDMEGVWKRVESQFDLRLGFIEALSQALGAVETQRSRQVCECLQRYARLLGGVAYCSEGEVARLLEEESHSLNTSALANRRSAAQLCTQLAAGEGGVWQEMKLRWRRAMERWRERVLQDTLEQFRTHTGVAEGGEGVGEGVKRRRRELEKVKEEMVDELSRLQQRKLELLTQLSSLGPSPVVMEMVHRLEESGKEWDQQISSSVQRQLLRLGQTGDHLVTACEAEMELCREWLVQSGVCDSSTVYQVLTSDYLPLIARLAEDSRRELQAIEQAVEAHIVHHRSWFQSAVQYGMGAAQLWRNHSSALAEVKRSREEVLERLRAEHDVKNQNGEANLDIILDHMRQAPNEEVLDKCQEEASALLEVIRGGYEEFLGEVVGLVRGGPEAVAHCVQEYDSLLCGYLGISREPPASSRGKKGKGAGRHSKRSKKTTPTTPAPRQSVAGMVEEVVVGGGAIRFYLVGGAEAEGAVAGVFLTQSEESEEAPRSIANQALPLSQERYMKTRTSLRALYLAHLEAWREEVRVQEEREAREREEEAQGELDLRLHLHRPRQTRITQDIHSVRAAELEAHRDRVGRHAKAVVTGISEVRATAQSAPVAMKTEEEFSREVESLVAGLPEISSTVGLQQAEKKAKVLLEKRLQRVKRISTDLQLLIETSLSDLLSANTAFRASLKLFSAAGNYCPEEVELFSRKLERLGCKLSAVQPQATAAVAQASSQHSQTMRETFSHFQSRYQLHWSDVRHLEEVKGSLTSLQLSIRSVVADSNLQASNLHNEITQLRNLLKSGDHTSFLEGLPQLVALLTCRIVYLHCRATVQQGGRVGTMVWQGGRVEEAPKQPISAVNVSQSIRKHTRVGGHLSPSAAGPSSQPPPSKTGQNTRTLGRKKAVALVERKNVNFGVGGGEERTRCFLPQIRLLLTTSYSQIYTETEEYYCGRGARPVVCRLLASSCEEALDGLIETCQAYRRQCEDYRNRAISEFRGQLETLLSLLVGVASLVLEGVRAPLMMEWERERDELESSHQQAMQEMMERKVLHEKALEPGLGHPAASGQLRQLSQAEEERHGQCLKQTSLHTSSLKSAVRRVGRELATDLVRATEKLLALCDSVPTNNEIIPGNEDTPKQLPVEQLLRLKLRPAQEVKDEGVSTSSSRGSQWPGLSSGLLERLGLEAEERARLSRKLSSKKTSDAHRAAVKARDMIFQEFVQSVGERVAERERQEVEEKGKEERWWEHWSQSLHSLAQLYS